MQRLTPVLVVLMCCLWGGRVAAAQEAPPREQAPPATEEPADTPSDEITLPAPERGVIYIRSGKPGGVHIRSRPGNRRRVSEPASQPAPLIVSSVLIDSLRREGVPDSTLLQMIADLTAQQQAMRDNTAQPVTRADLARLEQNLRALLEGRAAASGPSLSEQLQGRQNERVEIVQTKSGRPGVVFVPTPIPGQSTPRRDTILAEVPVGQAPFVVQPPTSVAGPVVLPIMTVPTAAQVERDMLETGIFRSLSINFETAKSTLLPNALQTLNAVGEVLVKYPELQVEVAGHTDNVGPEAYNQRLSQERAQSVAAYLSANVSVAPGHLIARGYGESMPIASNASATGRALNRRVEFRVLNPAAAAGRSQERQQADSLQQAAQVEALQEAIQRVLQAELQRMQATLDSMQAQQAAQLQRLAADSTGRLPDSTRQVEITIPPPSDAGAQDFGDPRNGFKGIMALVGFTSGYADQYAVGLRGDIRTKLLVRLRLVPEFVYGTGDGSRSYHGSFYGMLSLPKLLIDPYVGIGVGWLGFSDAEAVQRQDASTLTINVPIGIEFSSGFFLEYTMIDWGDLNRFSAGYRLAF